MGRNGLDDGGGGKGLGKREERVRVRVIKPQKFCVQPEYTTANYSGCTQATKTRRLWGRRMTNLEYQLDGRHARSVLVQPNWHDVIFF